MCDDKECNAENAYNLIDERQSNVLLRAYAYDAGDPHGPRRLQEACDPETVRSSAREVDGGESGEGGAWAYGALAAAAALVVVGGVVAGARRIDDALGGASVGERLAGCWRGARGWFGGGDAWERRRDPYEDVNAFERADFD